MPLISYVIFDYFRDLSNNKLIALPDLAFANLTRLTAL